VQNCPVRRGRGTRRSGATTGARAAAVGQALSGRHAPVIDPTGTPLLS